VAKKRRLINYSPARGLAGISLIHSRFLAITFEPETLKSQSNPPKTRIIA